MSSPSQHPPSPRDMIETAAVHWLLEREEGFTPSRARAFAAWRAASPLHAAEYLKAEAALGVLQEMPQARSRLRPPPIVPFEPPARSFAVLPPARRAIAWAMGLAAAVVMAGFLGWTVWKRPASDGLHVITQATSPQLVALNDGSLVDVNSNSALKVRMLPGERDVELSVGEAHFEVAHDSARPFIVNAAGVTVRAIGTAFTVIVRENTVEVLVVEGRVELSRTSLLGARKTRETAPLVVASERAVVDRGDQDKLPVIAPVDAHTIQAALAWHTQITDFSNLTLGQIVALFNRRNSVQLVIADQELEARCIGGAFAIDQPLAFVRVLERDGDIHAEPRGDRTIVLRALR